MFCCVPQAHRRRVHDASAMLCKAMEKMTVGPVGVGCQEQASNHPVRLSLRVAVVSDREKASNDSSGMNREDERK